MASTQSTTQTIILPRKEGINLEDITRGSSKLGVKQFIECTDVIKAQEGFVDQYWGYQVENPALFVWSIGWKSFQAYSDFIHSEDHGPFTANLAQLFDLTKSTPCILFTHWPADVGPALRAPVTEVAFFTLPNGVSEEVKSAVDKALEPLGSAVISIGKAYGSAMGWAFKVNPPAKETPEHGGDLLAGIFGYESIEAHMKWRATPEHAQAGEIFDDLANKGITLEPDTSISGIGLDTGYFHVRFQAGISI